ncbi:hypothetical protein [Parasitella parasitica]|uniref:Zinc/iron permease n=1 Tax=Parasitella parasitica TaxID=35722 RepID=A0A0B7MW90_9FUNG|nr:hypothetical protein [Parasitella parasitica]
MMPDAIHACGDASESCHHTEDSQINHQHNHTHQHELHQERRKLNDHPCDVEYGAIRSSESHFRFHHDDLLHSNEPLHQNNQGDDTVSECSSTHHHNHHESVEQTVNNDPGHYYSIGIQTAIAICVHKFPEGLIMFVSSKASATLGLSVGIAMSIHNLTEGFMIALPLYYATRSRSTAFTFAAIMGGFSQPLGALIGLFLIKNISKQRENLLFGIVFGCVDRNRKETKIVLKTFSTSQLDKTLCSNLFALVNQRLHMKTEFLSALVVPPLARQNALPFAILLAQQED